MSSLYKRANEIYVNTQGPTSEAHINAQFRKYYLPYYLMNELIRIRANIETFASSGAMFWTIDIECPNEDCFDMLRKAMIRALRAEGFGARRWAFESICIDWV